MNDYESLLQRHNNLQINNEDHGIPISKLYNSSILPQIPGIGYYVNVYIVFNFPGT